MDTKYFSFIGKNNNNNKYFQFWRHDYQSIELNTNEKLKQRINYLHDNPVRSAIVWEPLQYKFSRAIDYYTNNVAYSLFNFCAAKSRYNRVEYIDTSDRLGEHLRQMKKQ